MDVTSGRHHQTVKWLTLPYTPYIMINKESREAVRDRKIKVGITHGDLNGIGYEVIIKALNDNRLFDSFTPVIYGLSKALSYHHNELNINDFQYKVIRRAEQAVPQKVNIVNLSDEEVRIEYGKSTATAGQFAYQALEEAVRDLKDDKIQVLVTAPINKHNVQSDSFQFPGHTEYLASRFQSKSALMLMVKDNLRIGVVTGHIPLSEVPDTITGDLIIEKLVMINNSLKRDFGIDKPKIAVLGLNPHAGDSGLIGKEDETKVKPAIQEAWERDILAFGPFPADGFFGASSFRQYDAVLAMYHDQGLIPFKTLAFEGGVNFTAGLPAVRTSPAHGTAYDKAGKNVSSPAAMREAIYLAIDVYQKRLQFEEMTANPLKSGSSRNNANTKNRKENAEHRQDED